MSEADAYHGAGLEAPDPAVRAKGGRTRSLIVLCLLQVVQSLGILGFAVFQFSIPADSFLQNDTLLRFSPFAWFSGISSGWFYLLLAGLLLLVAAALFRLRAWAWRAAITLQGVGLLAALLGYVRGAPNYVGMVMGILLVVYLNLDEVQTAFKR